MCVSVLLVVQFTYCSVVWPSPSSSFATTIFGRVLLRAPHRFMFPFDTKSQTSRLRFRLLFIMCHARARLFVSELSSSSMFAVEHELRHTFRHAWAVYSCARCSVLADKIVAIKENPRNVCAMTAQCTFTAKREHHIACARFTCGNNEIVLQIAHTHTQRPIRERRQKSSTHWVDWQWKHCNVKCG